MDSTAAEYSLAGMSAVASTCMYASKSRISTESDFSSDSARVFANAQSSFF